MALGVTNPRYAMPSLSFVPVLAAYVYRGFAGGFGEKRRRIARWCMLGSPWAWPAALALAAVVYVGWAEPRRRATSGREAGLELGRLLPEGALVWADHMIEARPEMLLYTGLSRPRTKVVWVPRMAEMGALPRKGWLVLRTDAQSGEAEAYRRAGLLDRFQERGRWTVHKFECMAMEKAE
jgi:hypothetical protein